MDGCRLCAANAAARRRAARQTVSRNQLLDGTFNAGDSVTAHLER